MMRDDILRRKLRSSRPEPSGMFSERIHKTLKSLPKKRKGEAFGLLPASALVFAAVAALCVFAVSNKTVVNFFSPGAPRASQQLAAGYQPSHDPETPAPVQTSRPPTGSQQPGLTIRPTPAVPGSMTVNASCTAEGITETVEEACFDGYVYTMKIKFDGLPGDAYPGEDGYVVKINGYQIGGGSMREYDRDGASQKLSFYMPACMDASSDMVHVEVTNNLNKYQGPNGWKGVGTPYVDMAIEFDLQVAKPLEIDGSAEGSIGGKFAVTGARVYQSCGAVTLALTLKDDLAGDLASYLNKRKNATEQELLNLTSPFENYAFDGYLGVVTSDDFNKSASDMKKFNQQRGVASLSCGWLTRQADDSIALVLYLMPNYTPSDSLTIVADQMPLKQNEMTRTDYLYVRFDSPSQPIAKPSDGADMQETAPAVTSAPLN